MMENRRHFRLREILDVAWKVDNEETSGEGIVLNISTSGMLLQTDRVFKLSDHSILSIESATQDLPLVAKKGKVMWFRRIHTPQERYQCGVRFLEDKMDKDFQQWFAMKVNRLTETANVNILGNFAV
jgi:hypothetical protein